MSRHIRTLLQITCGVYPDATITIKPKIASGTRKRGILKQPNTCGFYPSASITIELKKEPTVRTSYLKKQLCRLKTLSGRIRFDNA